MSRLIDADKLYPDCITKNGTLAISQNQIANAPAVEYTFEEAFQKTVCEKRLYCPERPHGKWILKETDYDDGGNNLYECDNCHHSDIHSGSIEVPYCWYCGAEMRGDK